VCKNESAAGSIQSKSSKMTVIFNSAEGGFEGRGKRKFRGHARRGWESKLEGNRSHSHFIYYLIFLYSIIKQTFVKEKYRKRL
jgi:hypothetical protein